jgi:hypothetical protein
MSWEDFAEGFASGFVPAYNARIEREARRAATKEDREYAAQVREEEREAQRELFEWQITRENQMEQSAKDREYGAITDSVMTQYDLPDAVRPQVFASVRATGSAEGFIERYEDGDISLSGSAPKTFAPEELGSMLNKVNSQFNLPEGYLYTTAGIESSYNPKAENQNSSAGGLFQQMDANAQQYGVTNRFDPVESTLGAAKFALDNAETLRGILGRNPNGAELYLAHQQGAGGASALLSDPNANVLDVMTRVYGGHRAKAKKAVQNNGGDLSMTAGEFANLWIDKYNSRASVFMPDEEARPSGPAPDGFGLNASTDSEMSDLFTGASGLSFNEENEEPVDQFGMMSADSLDMGRSIDRTAQLPSVETPDTRSLEFGVGSSIDFEEIFGEATTQEEVNRLVSVYGPNMSGAEKERAEQYRESLPLKSDVISDDVQEYMTAGYPEEVAEKLALGTLQIVKDEVTKKMFIVDIGTGEAYSPVDLMVQGTGEATGVASTEGEETSDALEINVPDDYDISEASPEAVEIANLSPEQREAEIASLESDLQDLGDGSVEGFEATLRTIDLGAALGLRGMFGGALNKAAGAIGADSPRPKTRTSAAALERLQRLSALTLAQAQANQKGSVYLLNMLQANDISPNEFIGVEGALEKFRANYSLISDRVRDLEQVGSGDANIKPEEVSRANAVLPGLKRLQSYYGALVLNAQDRVSERANGEDERPSILATPDDGSDPKRIPDGAVDMLLNGMEDESTREELMGYFDSRFGAGKAQEVLDAYK